MSYNKRRIEKEPNYVAYIKTKKDEAQQRYMHKLKRLVIDHYSNGTGVCNCCNENKIEFLSIDHMYGGGNQHRKANKGMHTYRWLKANNFPPGFQVLCMNCNWATGIYGYCPHKRQELTINE